MRRMDKPMKSFQSKVFLAKQSMFKGDSNDAENGLKSGQVFESHDGFR